VVSGSKGVRDARKSRPARLGLQKTYKRGAMYAQKTLRSLTDEEELTCLEEARQEDEETEESSEAEEEVGSLASKPHWGYGVTWYPYGLQLWE
jgi:hypothetical protein